MYSRVSWRFRAAGRETSLDDDVLKRRMASETTGRQQKSGAFWLPPNRDYFTVRVADPHAARNVSQVPYERQRGNLYVGPSVRLTGPGGCVQLDNRELAERFAEHALTELREGHGDDIELVAVVGTAPTRISVRCAV